MRRASWTTAFKATVIACSFTLTAAAGDVAVPSKPMDLTWATRDPNGFPFNPDWFGQSGRLHGTADAPDLDAGPACGFFDNRGGILRVDSCTSQDVSVDEARPFHGIVPNIVSYLCQFSYDKREEFGGHSVHGHINWQVATYEGGLSFDDYQFPSIGGGHLIPADGDLDLHLSRDDHRGYVKGSAVQDGQGIVLEANRRELGPMTTPWWSDFEHAFTRDPSFDGARKKLSNVPAIVIGLLGIDTKHGTHTELHPIYAIFARVSKGGDVPEHWIFLARNWGSEGGCSNEPHPLERMQLSVQITSGAVARPVVGNVVTTPTNAAAAVHQRPDGRAALVTVELGPNAAKPVILGEFDLCDAHCPVVRTSRAVGTNEPSRR